MYQPPPTYLGQVESSRLPSSNFVLRTEVLRFSSSGTAASEDTGRANDTTRTAAAVTSMLLSTTMERVAQSTEFGSPRGVASPN